MARARAPGGDAVAKARRPPRRARPRRSRSTARRPSRRRSSGAQAARRPRARAERAGRSDSGGRIVAESLRQEPPRVTRVPSGVLVPPSIRIDRSSPRDQRIVRALRKGGRGKRERNGDERHTERKTPAALTPPPHKGSVRRRPGSARPVTKRPPEAGTQQQRNPQQVLALAAEPCAGEDLNLHGLKRPLGPQPSASTNSATSA